MNIPLSALEPFGVLGIPLIGIDAKAHSNHICETVYRYALAMSKDRLDIPTDTVNHQAVWLAKREGAKWAQCQLWKAYENGDRIFTLHFNAKGYPRVTSFGFAVGKIVKEPVWP